MKKTVYISLLLLRNPKQVGIGLLLLLAPVAVNAQETLLFHNVNKDTSEGDYGPNRKHYWGQVFQLGCHFGNTDSSGSDVIVPRSVEVVVGAQYKRKLSAFYALGFRADFQFSNYQIKQSPDKVFGGQIEHKREKLSIVQAGFSAYQQFNFSLRRGNHLGKYLDIGVYTDWQFYRRYIIADRVDPVYGFYGQRTSFKLINWLNYINYGAEARLGISFFYIFGKYRLSDMLKRTQSFPYPELPRYTAGIGMIIGYN